MEKENRGKLIFRELSFAGGLYKMQVDPKPSEEDISTTKRLIEAGKLVGISIIDHIIITSGEHFSFKDQLTI